MLNQPHLRVARPTDNLPDILRFYRDGLGLEVLSHFEEHDGFDGVMLGRGDWPYHFEFTHKRGHHAGRASTSDNLLVFYLTDEKAWRQAVGRMEQHGFSPIRSFNPYWDKSGKTFEDPDGYRIVLQHGSWPV